MSRRWRARALMATGVTAALAAGGCGRPPADDAAAAADHSHSGGGVVTHWTEALELFVEYPPHVQGVASDPWAIHLTWLEDWKPVLEGALALVLRGPDGAREEIALDAPDRPGVYTATPTLPATGTWRADMTLSVGGRDHEIPVGQLEVFENEDALPHDVEQPPPNLITLLKEQQWSMPFAVDLAEERRIPASIPATGEILAPTGGLAHVSAPVAGVVLVRGPVPAPGDRVQAGETLALIAPVGIDDSYLRMRADVVSARREAARAERLFAAGAIPQRRLQEARHELEVALAAFEAIGGMRPANAGEDDSEQYLYELRSPIGGVISGRHVAPGEHVQVGTHAFTVVNPARLWFVARVPARHAGVMSGVRGAWFTVEGGARTYRVGRAAATGSVIDSENRTLPVHFTVSNVDGSLKVGMFAEGRILVGAPVAGAAVPAPAVQEEDGLSVVYVKVGGEAFQRRVVELGPSDGKWTIVLSGIEVGDEVVTTGAYQVKLASLGDAELSDHGHPH